MSHLKSPSFPTLLQDFFCQRLIAQRNASARTVASYRDSFRLLLRYAHSHLRKAPAALSLTDLNAPFILSFLDYLEKERGNSVRSRNARLSAVRSFLRYASFRDPEALTTIQSVLAIPTKRFDRPLLGFLTRDEIQAILLAPDQSTWSGQRDHIMLATFYNTGARVSEIIALRIMDVVLGRDASVHIRGKGRKARVTPLWRSTAKLLQTWSTHIRRAPDAPVFPNRDGAPLSRSGIEQRLRKAVEVAQVSCPTLCGRRISPHTLRHTTAMHLLQSGIDITVIALWLGHESPATTHRYIEADLAMKDRALKHLQPPRTRSVRYRAPDSVLAFLDSL